MCVGWWLILGRLFVWCRLHIILGRGGLGSVKYLEGRGSRWVRLYLYFEPLSIHIYNIIYIYPAAFGKTRHRACMLRCFVASLPHCLSASLRYCFVA